MENKYEINYKALMPLYSEYWYNIGYTDYIIDDLIDDIPVMKFIKKSRRKNFLMETLENRLNKLGKNKLGALAVNEYISLLVSPKYITVCCNLLDSNGDYETLSSNYRILHNKITEQSKNIDDFNNNIESFVNDIIKDIKNKPLIYGVLGIRPDDINIILIDKIIDSYKNSSNKILNESHIKYLEMLKQKSITLKELNNYKELLNGLVEVN